MRSRRWWGAAVAALCLTGAIAVAQETHGIDTLGMNPAVAPGDDFYAYANGAWMATATIPAESPSWGRLVEARELTRQRTAMVLEDAAKLGVLRQAREAEKAGDFYASFMDEETVEQRKLSPLIPDLRRIAAISTKRALAKAIGASLRADVDPLNNTNFFTENLFGLWVSPDMNQSNRNTVYLLQGGLGMPDREYYLQNYERVAAIRAAYQTHVANVLRLAGIDDADAKAQRIVALETLIAKVHSSRTDNADVHKGNNPWTRSDFNARAPGLDWDAFFEGAALSNQQNFIVWQPHAFTGISALVKTVPLQTWKDYLAFHLVNHNSAYLSHEFVDELFGFYGTTLTGALEQRARWKRAVDAVNISMPDAAGQLYVRRYFPPTTKARVQEMVANIRAAFARRIQALEWMSPQTKAKALVKLNGLYIGVGYPEHWKSYAGLGVIRTDLAGNIARAEEFEYRRQLAKLTQPVDRSEWAMNPQTVNAVNIPLQNALNFPAAYLQPPFYDSAADEAYNYGGIGVTIGHEISHAFDDQGSQFDAQGRLIDWWTPDDNAHFQAASERLVKQYDRYCPFAGACVNGRQTLSENIADVGGVAVAYDAWRATGARASGAPGFTADQEFFISFAQRWRSVTREDAQRQLLIADGHSPAMYRALTVRNIAPWYAAFGIKPSDKLYLAPADRGNVW